MNSRERFIETMVHRNPNVKTLKWEFGYWGGTMNQWYKEGLPKKNYAQVPSEYTDITNSVYTYAWRADNKYISGDEYPNGYALSGGNVYMPSQGFAIDSDVRDYFGLDKIMMRVDVNLFFDPIYEPRTIFESDEKLEYIDVDGARRIYLKESATIPTTFDCPIKDLKSWEKVKEERLSFKNIKSRFPKNWEKVFEEYRNRDYPLVLGGYPFGIFGTLAHLLGYEKLFYAYYDDPELIHDMLGTFTDLWIAVFEEALQYTTVDAAQIWEDISFGNGCMISSDLMNEFMRPYYQKLVAFFKSKGIEAIFVDTDGNCWDIIPFFLECGVTGMFPFEADCKMDVAKVRRKYPDLMMCGGIPKSQIGLGRARIDQLLDAAAPVIKGGRYIPFGDHFIPPEVHFEDFKYYREKLNRLIEES